MCLMCIEVETITDEGVPLSFNSSARPEVRGTAEPHGGAYPP